MTKNTKSLIRIIISIALFVAAFCVYKLCTLSWWINLILFLIPYLLSSYDIFIKAAINIRHGKIFDENFLMLVATIGAFALLDFPEGVAVMLFYQVGEWFQRLAVGKSRRSIQHLVELCPTTARVLREGKEIEIAPEEVEIGEYVTVRVGERVPIDGQISNGESDLDVSALTGESVPVRARVGDAVLSGAINTRALLTVQTTKKFEDSAVSKILELVENASDRKTHAEQFITVFARYYTPIVVSMAVLLCIIPSAITGNWAMWGERALSFLVVSCPCALVISVPMSFFGGIGCASKHGILLKGSTYLEVINRVDTFAFDKTGTLTQGVFKVAEVMPNENRDWILSLASIAERSSTHPIATAIVKECGNSMTNAAYLYQDFTGEGVAATASDGTAIYAGNEKLMARFGVKVDLQPTVHGSTVYVAENGVLCGLIVVGDVIKDEAKESIEALHGLGCKTVILSGDRGETVQAVAQSVGADVVYSELLPVDKVQKVEALLHERGKVAFVGDGVNDAPVLMRADVGVAMGGIGSDAAIEAADVVITHDSLRALPLLFKIAKKTMRIVRENVVFALAVKAVVLVLSALGYANMWIAVFADVGVAILAILNAMRAMRIKNREKKGK